MNRRGVWGLLFIFLITSASLGQITANVTGEIAGIRAELRQAGAFYRTNKLRKSAATLATVKRRLAALPQDPAVQEAAKPLQLSLSKAVQLLGTRGISIPSQSDQPSSNLDSEISFSADLAETLATRCTSCHGGNNPRRGLRIESFSLLMKGSDQGPVIIPGDPANSLLITKLRGTGADARMPLDGPYLADSFVAKFSSWIRAGADFDGDAPSLSLDRVAALARMSRYTPDELAREQTNMALSNWRLAFPGESPTKLETDAFLLLGKLQPNELRDVAEEVDKALEKATNVLKLPTAKSVHKGRTTVYVLPKRYDYGEFGQMVEKRRLPIEMHGHWQSQGFMPYIVVGPQTEASIPTQALLGRCLAALLVSSWSDVPEWYADGMGHVAAERMSRRDPQIRTWPSRAASVVRNLESPAQLLSGDLAPEVAGIVNWAFVRYLMQDGRRSSRLLHALQKGAAFETAFVGAYGAPPDAYCERWFKRNTGKRK